MPRILIALQQLSLEPAVIQSCSVIVRKISAEAAFAAPSAKAAIAPSPAASYRPPLGSTLQRYGRDLTAEAAAGRLDPLLGRADVVERTLQILLRRTKNNPCLIGDPGVGKTAIVEGIAQAAVHPSAPLTLQGRSIVALDVGALVAGTQYRGAFEERLQGVLQDVRAASGRVILFIDEIHMLMDAGRVEGGTNAANLLKPALARGELRCIGATTVEEYRRHVEQDAAFARRLQPVMVEEPSAEEAVAWLQGVAPRYEQHHGVLFAAEALEMAVSMAQRFVPDRRLPDSAIDVLDEAASRVQLRQAAESMASIEKEMEQQQQSPLPSTRSSTAASQPQPSSTPPPTQHWSPALAAVGSRDPAEVQRLLEWFGAAPAAPLPGIAGHRQTVEARRRMFLQQFGEGNFTRPPTDGTSPNSGGGDGHGDAMEAEVRSSAAPLSCPHCGTPTPSVAGAATVACPRCRFRFLNIPPEKLQLGSSLFLKPSVSRRASSPAESTDKSSGSSSSSSTAGETIANPPLPVQQLPVVTAFDVMSVVAGAAGIPVEQVQQVRSSWRSLEQLEGKLLEAVHGQPAAVKAAAAAVRLGSALAHQQGRRRPLAALLLTGPAGAGKGTLCAALATALFGSDRALLRFDLSQSTERTAVNRLVGAPPGFVGYGEGGALTEAVRRRPHCVVVFKNAHLAHPDVATLLQQIFEEGELHDSMGKRANFRNAVVVMTAPAAPSLNNARAPTPKEASQFSVPQWPNALDQGAGPGSRPPSSAPGSRAEAAQHSAAALSLAPALQPARKSGERPSDALSHDLAKNVDAVVAFEALGVEALLEIAATLVDEAAPALGAQGIALVVGQAALGAAAERAVASGGGAEGLGSAVRNLILTPAVDAALRAMAADNGREGGEQHQGPWTVQVDYSEVGQHFIAECI